MTRVHKYLTTMIIWYRTISRLLKREYDLKYKTLRINGRIKWNFKYVRWSFLQLIVKHVVYTVKVH